MTVATIEGDRLLTWDDRPDSEACQACPMGDACYRRTSTLLNAYKRGCRHPEARQANTDNWRAKYGKDSKRPVDISSDPDEENWQTETPFVAGEGKYSSHRANAYCAVCGSEAEALSARGTLVICKLCEANTPEASSQERLDTVLDRYEKTSRRAVEKTPELTVEEKLEIAGGAGMILDAINATIDRLSPDLNIGPTLAARAAGMIHRLKLLASLVSPIARNPTSEGTEALIKLVDVLQQEQVKAAGIIGELDNAARYIRQQAETKALPPAPMAEPAAEPARYFQAEPAGYYKAEPEPEEDEYYGVPEGDYRCEIAGHAFYTKAAFVLYLGQSPNPGLDSRADHTIFVCGKHADVGKLLRATGWQSCWNLETIDE